MGIGNWELIVKPQISHKEAKKFQNKWKRGHHTCMSSKLAVLDWFLASVAAYLKKYTKQSVK